MFNLIIKDILIQKKTVLFIFAYIILLMIIFKEGGFVLSIVVTSYLLILTGFALDEKNKADVMLNSLPIKRRNIVLSKYLSIFIYVGIGTFAYFITIIMIKLMGSPITIRPVTIEDTIGALFAVAILNCIYLPVVFKLGYLKSKVVNLILFLVIFFGGPMLVKKVGLIENNKFINTIINLFNSKSDLQISVFILGIVIIMFISSFLLSVKLYESREF